MNNGKRQFRIARRRLDRRIHGEVASEIINDWKEWMADNPKEWAAIMKEGRYVEE